MAKPDGKMLLAVQRQRYDPPDHPIRFGRPRDHRKSLVSLVDDLDVLAPGRRWGTRNHASCERWRVGHVHGTELLLEALAEIRALLGGVESMFLGDLAWWNKDAFEMNAVLWMTSLPGLQLRQEIAGDLPAPVWQFRREVIASEPFKPSHIRLNALDR